MINNIMFICRSNKPELFIFGGRKSKALVLLSNWTKQYCAGDTSVVVVL